MPKKPKTPKPLPSVLTVAGPSLSKSRSSRQKSSAGSSPTRTGKAVTTPAKPKTSSGRNVSETLGSLGTPSQPAATEPVQPRVDPQPQAVEVTFSLHRPQAQRVLLGGSFNQWSTESTPLQLLGDGRWETRLTLPPGRHEYKFLVDGEWVADPSATVQASNEYGTVNSILEV